MSIGVTTALGAIQPLENALQNFGFVLREAPASGQVHVVEMDAASVAAIRRWPWDREHYARVIDTLDQAGARTIAFDVDFSTPSTPSQDARFGRSLAQAAATMVLPVFGQRSAFDDKRQLESRPMPECRDPVGLGSVSVAPGTDGVVRDMPIGTLNAGAPRPSLSAQVAQRSGSAGANFPIDFAIRPDSLPRHSFVAVERGEFEPGTFRGKDVIIGATAIEMGDRYAVPVHGVLPGVIVQALAAETLQDGVPVRFGWQLPLIVAAIMAYWILAASRRSRIAIRAAGAAGLLQAFLHFGAVFYDIHIAIAPAMLVIAATAAVRWTLLVRCEFEEARMIDPESGLPNRRSLEKRVGAGSGERVIVTMIDKFDAVKIVIGQQAAGAIIQRLSERLRVGGCSGTIYRIDERALAWISSLEPFALEDQLQGLTAIMRQPVEVAGRRVNAKIAFGIAEDHAHGDAVHAASLALERGVNFVYHEQAEKIVLDQQMVLMGELEGAIRNGELSVLYQPKLDLRLNRITSAEALVRWQHPTRGNLRPDLFIPLAEEANRIDELTVFVLRRAIEDLILWCRDGLVMKVAVNISAGLIGSSAFLSRIEYILRAADLPRDRLIFEITESAAIGRLEEARAALQRFRDLGVLISMDDYGTGQSTLSYLKSLPLNELKIDRSFVQYAHCDHNDALLVESTVELAHQLGLEVVAEGIEDVDCLNFLRSIDCDYAQGYYIGRPMIAASLFDLTLESLPRAA